MAPVEISAGENHQQHNHDAESCTPFCTCSCCASSVFFASQLKTPGDKPGTLQVQHPLYNLSFTSFAASCIWQPPKMA
jgi:hypothetical protein